ncbi:MAG: glycosyltransferase family 4 protein [Gemmatimonadota bacterium]
MHLHEIFRRLVARGHAVRLLASGWPEAPPVETLDGIEVHRAGGRHSFPLRVRRRYRALLGAAPVDLVVEDINKVPLYSPLWAGRPVAALVPHLFGTTAFREASWPVAAAVWAAERGIPRAYRRVPFLAISRSTADDLVARGVPRSRVDIVPPGIDHERYRPGPAEGRFERPTLVYVGRLKRYKALDVVLRALVGVAERVPAARLVAAGRGDDRTRLERIARALGVADRVEFLGYVDEVRKVQLLQRAWVSVYPSPKEGWGLVNVEAAACGTPVVASDSPGLRESIRPGESGFLVPHRDAEAWAGRLVALLEDAALRRRIGEAGIRHAAGFSWEHTTERTERFLRRALTPTAGKRMNDEEERDARDSLGQTLRDRR